MMNIIWILVLLMGAIDADNIDKSIRGGVSFLDQGNFLLSNARWTIVFDIPTNQFENHLGNIKRALRHFQSIIVKVNTTSYCRDGKHDWCMASSTFRESVQLCKAVDALDNEIYSYEWMKRSPRDKRGLIDGGGKVLKFLFGVADSDDINKVNKNIGSMRRQLTETIHYLGVQATYINHTIDAVIETRHAVIKLESAIRMINDDKQRIENSIFLTHIMHTIELAFDGIWREWINFRDAIHEMGLGNLSPYLIGPGKLLIMLTAVRDHLPEQMQLLTAINMDTVHSAYGWIKTVPTRMGRDLRIFLQIPLKTNHNHFSLYRLLLVPELIPNSSMAMVIEPESPFIAVTSDRRSHMLISTLDLLQCTEGVLRFCDLPNMVRQESCAMSLLTGAQEEVKAMCPRKIIPKPKAIAYRLDDNGHWLYSVPVPTPLDIKCPRKSEDRRVTLRGQGFIQVPDSCTGYADSFKLPPHFQGRTAYKLTPPGLATLDSFNMLDDVDLKLVKDKMEEADKISKELSVSRLTPEIEHIPLEQFQRMIITDNDQSFSEGHAPTYISIFVLLGLTGLILCCCCCKTARDNLKKWNRQDSCISKRTGNFIGPGNTATLGRLTRHDVNYADECGSPEVRETVWDETGPETGPYAIAEIGTPSNYLVPATVTYANVHPIPKTRKSEKKAGTSTKLETIPEVNEATGEAIEYDQPKSLGARPKTKTIIL